MGALKLEAQKRIKAAQERGQDGLERGEQRIKELEAHQSFSQIEAIDLDDIAALMDCGRKYSVTELTEQFGLTEEQAKSLVETEQELEIVIPVDSPLRISGPGFDDCLSADEIAYMHKEHSQITLNDDAVFHDNTDLTCALEESCAAITVDEEYEAEDKKFEDLVEALENVF